MTNNNGGGGAGGFSVSALVVHDPGEIDRDAIRDIFDRYEDGLDGSPGPSSAKKRKNAGRDGDGLVNRTIVEPSLNKRYRNDPLQTIQRNAAPYHHAEELADFSDMIAQMGEWKDTRKAAEKKLWDNEEVRFIRMVEANTRDQTLLVKLRLQDIAGVNSEANNLIIRQNIANAANPTGPPAPAVQFAAAQDNDNMTSRGIMPSNTAAFARQGTVAGPPSAAAREYAVMNTVRRMMETPEVSGEYRMSDLLYSKVLKALTLLRIQNPQKFDDAKAAMMYKDEEVMVMFADLVGTLITLTKIHAPKGYDNNVIEPRRVSQANAEVRKMDIYTKWDPRLGAFRFARGRDVQTNIEEMTVNKYDSSYL